MLSIGPGGEGAGGGEGDEKFGGCFRVAALIGCSCKVPSNINVAGWKKVNRKVRSCGPRGRLTALTWFVDLLSTEP